MKNGHYEPSDCPSYSGNGFCKFKNLRKCSYLQRGGVCGVSGNLTGCLRVKTRYEAENEEGKGFTRLMNGMMRLS
jgi:hypothetical protein